ncbi:MAG: tyrosine--tRNA ligase [Pyrobaculum sp.]
MDVERRLSLILRYPTEEVITVEELRELLETGHRLSHYIGFEISGFIHLGTGIVSMSKVVDLQKAGVRTQIFLADIHSWLNNKLGGDLDTIRRVAVTYYKEAFRKVIEVLGGDPDGVRFVLGSDLYHHNDEYWLLLMDIARHVTLSQVRHSLTILGRKMGESIPLAYLIYPPLQVADVFALEAHIPHGGIDQRRAHILAREVAERIRFYPLKLGEKRIKPVALHHRLLPALNLSTKPTSREELSELKMSKSVPQSAVFIHDSPEDIVNKIAKAYCPPRDVEYNPVLEILRIVEFREERKTPFVIKRPEKYGGDVEVWSYGEVEALYKEGKIHPADLKNATAEALAALLQPVYKYFQGPGRWVLEEMRDISITR